jgi:uncharacterized protein YwbE
MWTFSSVLKHMPVLKNSHDLCEKLAGLTRGFVQRIIAQSPWHDKNLQKNNLPSQQF